MNQINLDSQVQNRANTTSTQLVESNKNVKSNAITTVSAVATVAFFGMLYLKYAQPMSTEVALYEPMCPFNSTVTALSTRVLNVYPSTVCVAFSHNMCLANATRQGFISGLTQFAGKVLANLGTGLTVSIPEKQSNSITLSATSMPTSQKFSNVVQLVMDLFNRVWINANNGPVVQQISSTPTVNETTPYVCFLNNKIDANSTALVALKLPNSSSVNNTATSLANPKPPVKKKTWLEAYQDFERTLSLKINTESLANPNEEPPSRSFLSFSNWIGF